VKIFLLLGTRPEVIKLAPLYRELSKYRNLFNVKIINTGQHKEMVENLFQFFGIMPEWNLNIMTYNQSLYSITTKILNGIEKIFEKEYPDLLIVQGDTTSAMAGALGAFYKKIKIAHVEAGLRSYNKYSPFPEEINRVLISHISDIHFAPTEKAKENLLKEGIKEENIFVVGNTVIDAIFLTLEIIEKNPKLKNEIESFFIRKGVDFSKKIILVTTHRRENFGYPLEQICLAIRDISLKYDDDIQIIFPVHKNPNVHNIVYSFLNDFKNIILLEPLNYPYFVWIMSKSYLILTDSGGVQEEAPSLGIPVLVMRNTTERIEGIKIGISRLIGVSRESIVKNIEILLTNSGLYTNMSKNENPYGDGKASKKIVDILINIFNLNNL